MKPLHITATAFRSWERLDLRLDEGCTAIVGENGHGKTSIMLAIEAALFGGPLARRLNWDGASTELEVTLTFEHAGQVYRARRHYSARGAGKTTLDLEREVVPPRSSAVGIVGTVTNFREWESLTCATTTETQARLEQILGFGVDVFRASAWLAQRGPSFTTAPARDRKRILADILDLDLWPRLQERAKTDRTTAEQALAALVARRDQITADLAFHDETRAQHAAATERVEKLRAERADLEKGLAALDGELRAFDAAQAAAEEAAREHAHLHRQAGRERELAADADRAIVDLNARLAEKPTLEQEAWRVPDLNAAIARLREQRAARDAYVAEYEARHGAYHAASSAHLSAVAAVEDADRKAKSAVERRDAIANAAAPSCPTCGQDVHGDARARTLAAADRDVEAAVAEHRAAVGAVDSHRTATDDAARRLAGLAPVDEVVPDVPLDELERQLAAAQDARVKLAALHEVEKRLTDARAQAARASEALDDLAPALDRAQTRLDETRAAVAQMGDREQLDHRHRAAHAQAQNLGRQIEAGIGDQARWQARLDQLHQQAAQLPGIEQEHHAQAETVRALAALEKAYGPNGIPALILETTAIPALEHDATSLLRDLGLDRRVELRTQVAAKTTATLKDALEITVVSPTGAECTYEDLSGGELTRLDLALRIALARLVARRPGVEIGILALDEPEGLDEHGLASLAGILRSLDEFPVRIVVSHHPSLRDAFDRSIQVEKHNGVSRIAGHDIEEPSAA